MQDRLFEVAYFSAWCVPALVCVSVGRVVRAVLVGRKISGDQRLFGFGVALRVVMALRCALAWATVVASCHDVRAGPMQEDTHGSVDPSESCSLALPVLFLSTPG